ncbi:MAG TPA: carbamoyltransferase HypF [Terriglobia bacterium]|nr:carbamoyltransferase HypF [Terriglobia bacterium]
MMPVLKASVERRRVAMRGAVQGVGFRPFVYRLAGELGLTGWVRNSSAGLVIEVEGPGPALDRFLARLESETPMAAVVLETETAILAPAGSEQFEIIASDDGEEKTTSVLPELATCHDCLAEMEEPANRRFGYAFTNCTNCGPRYTIIEDIPYDRPRTTMREFVMCPDCQREYADPTDRRFHAQPIACPRCGPRLWTETADEASTVSAEILLKDAVTQAARVLGQGGIVALKGIGGFQLLADARQAGAVERLRQRKQREAKPFALMMPSLEMVRCYCEVSAEEARLLGSPAAPIVLLRPNGIPGLAPNVAGCSPYLGVMLPYSPLHHLLMEEFPFPIVATSGNLSDEPIAIDNEEARGRLSSIADLFLMHDRPIARPCDDSVARIVRGRESLVRRARGYAPLPVYVGRRLPPVLAVGGHLKNTIAIAVGRQVFLSQHVGDLDTVEARGAFERAIGDLCRLYRFKPELVACDLHPDYASTRWALASGLPVVATQHHQAHAAACAAENRIVGPYLAVSWDGTGYGPDGTVWGGEFFVADGARFERIAHLRPFRLPGGESAVRQGWRSAFSLLWEASWAGRLPGVKDGAVLAQMLERGVNAPWTTSVGRLFDAVASMTGVAHESQFEGQAAMRLEREISGISSGEAYPLPLRGALGDWGPLIEALQWDVGRGESAARMSARFHNALADWIVAVAEGAGLLQVALSGGVFQNGYLVERAAAVLEARGFQVHTHRQVPPNDGGIALGQAVLAAELGQGD